MELTAAQVGIWIGVLVLLIPAAKTVSDWVRPPTRNIEPQPLRVQPEPELAPRLHLHPDLQTEARCSNIHATIGQKFDQFSAEIRSSLREHDRKAEERTSAVHDRINSLIDGVNDKFTDISGDVAEIRGQLNNHIESERANHDA
jgi:hypothetical protein